MRDTYLVTMVVENGEAGRAPDVFLYAVNAPSREIAEERVRETVNVPIVA